MILHWTVGLLGSSDHFDRSVASAKVNKALKAGHISDISLFINYDEILLQCMAVKCCHPHGEIGAKQCNLVLFFGSSILQTDCRWLG